MTAMEQLGYAAKQAAPILAGASSAEKNRALLLIAEALEQRSEDILAANRQDLAEAEQNGVPPHMLDRLALSTERIAGIAAAVREVVALPDPVGEVTRMVRSADGLMIGNQRVPLGVIAMIYESRPNVTVDAAVLCLKAGNAVILRGGKEAIHSNIVLAELMRGCLEEAGLPADCIALVRDTSRASATELMGLVGYVDVLIPRGGAGLIRSVVDNAKVPVIETGVGICHIYVDQSADLEMAVEILFNAKTQRPSVCNAAEAVLVAEEIAADFLPLAKKKLDEKKVEWRGCGRTQTILPGIVAATEEDYRTEFNDYILAAKVVSGVEEAMAHIAAHGSGHSEAIITSDYRTAQLFLRTVDAAAVYVNASTRFTDGNVFGLGAEIGISTQKMHARGPIGLEQLTSNKFIVYGDGQVRG